MMFLVAQCVYVGCAGNLQLVWCVGTLQLTCRQDHVQIIHRTAMLCYAIIVKLSGVNPSFLTILNSRNQYDVGGIFSS